VCVCVCVCVRMPGSRCTVTNPVTPAEPEFGQIPNAGHDSQNASGGDTGGGGGWDVCEGCEGRGRRDLSLGC
jgi:hypothetical protein